MAHPTGRGNAVLQLCRFANLPPVWSNVIVGCFFANASTTTLLLMMASAACLYFSGAALNAAAVTDPERQPKRALPSGALPRTQITALGIAWLIAGSVLTLLAGASPILLAILLALIVVYAFIHPKTRWAAIPMGLAHGALVLLAGSVGAPLSAMQTLLLIVAAGAHTLYTIGLTWTAASSGPRRQANPRAQTLLLLSPIAAVAYLSMIRQSDIAMTAFTVLLVIGWAQWINRALPARRRPLPLPKALPRLTASIILIDALILFIFNPLTACYVAATLFPLTLWLQKRFTAI